MEETGEIERFVVQAIAEVTQVSWHEVWNKRSANVFHEFGVDSLLVVEIVETLEQRYRIELPGERIPETCTVEGAVALVKEILGSASSAAAA